MSRFHELNNYISDVPMRFSDKYLSLQVNDSFLENNTEDDFNKFQIEDYKFNAELVAIEIFELHQRRKETITSENLSTNRSSNNKENTQIKKDDSTNYFATSRPNIHSSRGANFFYNMVSGEILKPQPLLENTLTSQLSVHKKCDNSHSDNKSKSNFKQNMVNPRDFENDDSSPFDNVELQTIDDMKELNNVFRALNTNDKTV